MAFIRLLLKLIKSPGLVVNKYNFNRLIYHVKTGNWRTLLEKVRSFANKKIEFVPLELNIYKDLDTSQKLVFNKPDNPLVSIIIPVYNKWSFTYSCLYSILKHTTDVSYEVIVADDVSEDETREIANIIENIVVIRNERNLGFLHNCNNAAKHAGGKYILFLNNDTNVQDGWLKYLVDLIESDDSIGMVGSKLVYPDGRLQEAGGIIWRDASGWNYGRLEDPTRPEYNYVKEADYISGACIMIKSDLWRKIGGFDERFAPAYYEDTDLAFEVRKHGYKVMYQPKSVVVHFEGISHGTDLNSGIKSYQVKNRDKFIEKWKEVLNTQHFAAGQDVYWARDRSEGKKTILVIDHFVPHYDKDAGSRLTFQYLKLFVKMGLNVKFIGDNFFRHEPYTSELEQLGIEVLCGYWYQQHCKDWITTNSDKIDYAFLNRPLISVNYIDLLKKYTKAKIIYHGHDLHYLRELKRYEIEKDEALLKSSEYLKSIEFKLFSDSDVIFTVSHKEKEIIQQNFPDKQIIVFPIFYFDKFVDNRKDFNARKDLLFVGEFNHLPNVDGILWFVKSVFPKIVDRIPDIKLNIVGSNPPQEVLQLNSHNVIVKGFVDDDELKKIYNEVRVVVVPLRYGAGVKGKTVEAMYYQVPIVSTDFGIEGLYDIQNVILPHNDAEDFANEVVSIYLDKSRFDKISKQYSEYIKKYFSKDSAVASIRMALDETR